MDNQFYRYPHFSSERTENCKIVVDGETVIQGTGTEDFFNCGYYNMPGRLTGPQTMPTHGFSKFLPPRISAYRWFILDKIPFENQLTFTLEHGPDNRFPAAYETMVYFYTAAPSVM